METRQLAKTAKLLLAMGFSLLMVSAMLLALFLATLKPVLGGSSALLFFSALFTAFSLIYFVEYIRVHINKAAAEMCRRQPDTGT
jgi:hypothetical protein